MLLKHIEEYCKIEDILSGNDNNLSLILPLVKSILKVKSNLLTFQVRIYY